jgi:hypothetical protein
MMDIRIEDIVMQAVGKNAEWVRAKMSGVEATMDNAKRKILEDIEDKSLIRDKLDLDVVQKLLGKSYESHLTPAEVERFVRLFLSVHGGSLEAIKTGKDIFAVHLPEVLESDDRVCKSLYVSGWRNTEKGKVSFRECKPVTFCKEVAEEDDDIRLVALGHPLLSRIINVCMQPDFGGKTAVKLGLSGKGGALFVFRSRITDYENNIRGEKLISVMWDKTDNFFREVDSNAFWEFERASDYGQANEVIGRSEAFRTVYDQAQSTAVGLTDDLRDDTEKKVQREISIKITDIKNYRNAAIESLKRRIAQNESRSQRLIFLDKTEQERLKQSIGRDKAAIRRLTNKTEEDLGKLNRESQLICEAPECLGITILVPKKGQKETDESTLGIEEKREVEKAGIELVMKREIDQGRKPVDVSLMFKGYDIASEGTNEKRFIEVKSFKETGPLELTSHEWIVSERLGPKYWLYVVENVHDKEKRKITEICDPFVVFEKIAEQVSLLQFRILIENWKDQLKLD